MWLKRLFLVRAILDIFQQAIYFMSEKFINLLLSSYDFLFPLSNVEGHCNCCSYAMVALQEVNLSQTWIINQVLECRPKKICTLIG